MKAKRIRRKCPRCGTIAEEIYCPKEGCGALMQPLTGRPRKVKPVEIKATPVAKDKKDQIRLVLPFKVIIDVAVEQGEG